MKGCNEFKRMIDEADRPDRLPFEVTNHIDACADCRDFSAGRAGLRDLLTSMARVGAPANFDARLNARLEATRAGRQSFWLNPALYFRFGAVAAGVIVAIFAAQMSGVFSSPAPASAPPQVAVAERPAAPDQPDQKTSPAQSPRQSAPEVREQTHPPAAHVTIASVPRQPRRATASPRASALNEGFVASTGAGVVLVRGRSGDRELTVPAVSLGAQPLFYVNAGRQPSQQPRAAGTSF